MKDQPVDFALIGHQESWRATADVFASLRGPDYPPVPDEEIESIVPWIPPRTVCHVETRSRSGAQAHGLYIDSFIPPDRLDAAFIQENLRRVRGATACAIKTRAKIVSLGGFSSILIEGNFDMIPGRGDTVFTTGNSLTVAFIVSGIRRMCEHKGRDLRDATVLIVGATGDVGSGCARCLLPLVSRMILCGRNMERLQRLEKELERHGVQVDVAPNIFKLPARPDVVVCCASLPSPSLLLGELAPDALVCDAGYPKNLAPLGNKNGIKVFYGGLGQVSAGMTFAPEVGGVLNRHPFPDVVHGCLLEGMTLALERRFEPFSEGRGFITPERVEEMEKMADRHGIRLAPLYNGDGPIGIRQDCEAEGIRQWA
jgi:fatty aldehyde-generating acyl-ACP reductase